MIGNGTICYFGPYCIYAERFKQVTENMTSSILSLHQQTTS